MANTNSTTITSSEILCTQPVIESAITRLLKTPFGATMDLFQVLDCCESLVDALIENDDSTERVALCGRLYAGLEVLKVVLKAPLPAHLIERLTVEVAKENDYPCALSTDSETLREYCAALTMLLLQRQQSPEQEEHITGLVFELIGVLVEDLKAPRFIKTDAGLMMIGDATNEIH
ncbi:hypothetical protein MUA02_15330 [Enterobacteriaceae bacterium H20N1]|uniref:Uncharacterized protein n=1 Tax=Dryocola boscaweniae TaxID=2925397 RepID=A0A9X2W8X2_9ENTR|nr:hypothetical protein [Dryocola boscaweniae]MCT4703226.1 hypothetical protein [Dryocola boscaweniae]MCT4720394.1 hypothetical protein [Dryocola boscaweniae]